ncbi:galactose-binding domain-containing protein [Aquimarina agarivorans]|uniref:galactose-binding domain-containing protein n=1 Tax=Aquimarina agarivorans TaxID=980584 RepID=UPI000248F881|nr:ricin-type beta-trefoil lectin domain protein [Aquimarina agarivorans]
MKAQITKMLLLGLVALGSTANAQIFQDGRNCTRVPADNNGGNEVCVRVAPAPTGNANDIRSVLQNARIPQPVINSRLTQGFYANHIAGQAAVRETAAILAARRNTYTGQGTVVNQSNLEQNRAAIANNGGTFIFRGNITVNAISKFIQVGSNTTIWIDGTVTYTGPQPNGTTPDQFSVSDVVNGVFEVRGSNNRNRKSNVNFFGTKRGKIITNGRCAGVYTRFVRNLEISGVNFERCRNVLFINNTVDSKLEGNFIYQSERRAVHIKATNNVEVSRNLIFEAKVDGIDVDAFAKNTDVLKNVVCHTGDRFMIWTEIAVENTLVDQNVAMFMPNADRRALAYQENGSETTQPPTRDNTYSNNHVFYADLNKGNRGFVLNPRRRIVRESIVFKNNYVWQSITRKLPYEDPKTNVFDDVFYYTPGSNNNPAPSNPPVVVTPPPAPTPTPTPNPPANSGSNLATGKNVSQSSVYLNNQDFNARKAIDGDTSIFTHTNNDANAWWEVDLGVVSQINNVQVFNRSDCCQERLQNFHVLVSNTPFITKNLNQTIGQSGVGNFFTSGQAGSPSTININRSGRYVRIQLAGTNFLHIGEVRINGTAGSSGGNNGGSATTVVLTKRNASGFAIDGRAGGANQQNVYLWSRNTSNVNQQWDEISRGNGFFSYRKRNTNFCLDGGNGGTNGQNVKLFTCQTNNQNQHWRKVNINGNFRLEKRNAPGFSIDGGNGGARAQNVYLWASSNTNQNQQWSFSTAGGAKILDTATPEISVFPNPAQHVITVDNIEEFDTVTIYSIDGAKVLSKPLNNNLINVNALSNGVYLLEFTGDTFKRVERIVINN